MNRKCCLPVTMVKTYPSLSGTDAEYMHIFRCIRLGTLATLRLSNQTLNRRTVYYLSASASDVIVTAVGSANFVTIPLT